MQLSKEEYARKRMHNGCLVQIKSSVTQDNCPVISVTMINIIKYMSHDTTKRESSGVFDQARHKPACAATEAS